ncbi:hypothetical protein OCU04_012376 [Sclerotinia nivalis]|uniref:Uncharacterized protein n=1 Tax=Sclerotinia nivalis TaxID=352851 RepID=A0A9X0DF86_9HELO|nr:hypothetical protein OCU04_012376 [Sclerotinia nivalis]
MESAAFQVQSGFQQPYTHGPIPASSVNQNPHIKKKSKDGTEELQNVVGRQEEAPYNESHTLQTLRVALNLSLMDLLRVSPDPACNFGRL